MDTDQFIGEPIPDKEYYKRVDDEKKDAAPPAKKDQKDDHDRLWAPVISFVSKSFLNRGSKLPRGGPEDDEGAESRPTENLVLVGRTGNGKSATGNSILGQKLFDSRTRGAGVTMECKSIRCVTPNDRILNVIDTPGLFDLSVSADFIGEEIVKCLCLADGGLHAVLLVLSLRNRLSQEEEKVLSTLQILFGSKICEYLIVVFTAGDVLEEEGITLDTYLGPKLPKFLKRVFALCGNRKIVFDNKTTDERKKTKQVHELLNLVDKVKKQNNNIPYTDKMYYKIKEENDRYKKEQAELESKGHSEELLKALMKELQITHENSLKAMGEWMEKNIRTAMEDQEKLYGNKIEVLNETNQRLRDDIKEITSGCAIL